MMSSSEESDNNMEFTPPDILYEAQIQENGVLPEKSRERYLLMYNNFISWTTQRNTQSFSENVLMAYFNELSVKYKPSSMWSIYSMLKSTLKTNNDIDISKYIKLHVFLKRQSDGFTSKKSKVFTAANIEKFLNDAPDEKYLATKAILIFGISGACRRQELANINESDIENHGDLLLVKIPDTKTKYPRTFTIQGQFYTIVKKYQALRITNKKSNRFFQKYQHGKCSRQVVGINKIGRVPKEIATFLKLENPASYTGHSFRSTSATLLANSGPDIVTLKRQGGWCSNNVAEGSNEDSVHFKIEIDDNISKSIKNNNAEELPPSTSRENVQPSPPPQQAPPPPPSAPPPSTSPPPPPPLSPTFSTYSSVEHNIYEINNIIQSVKLPKQQVSLNFINCSNFTINFHE